MTVTTTEATRPPRRLRWFGYGLICVLIALATFGVMWLWQNIVERKEEAKQHVFRVVELTDETIDPAVWGKNYPRQYDGYLRTVDNERSSHGGSDALPPSKLEAEPRLRIIFKGYAFAVDYRERRGHAFMLSDQDMTERVKQFKQPGACLHCHASVLPAYRAAGVKAGVPHDEAHRLEAIMKGFEEVCAMPYGEARKLVGHPVSCVDCHDPDTMALRVQRPAFLTGLRALASSEDPVPHLPSISRWRKGPRKEEYDPNRDASRQEMRSMVCAQCHVEYYFHGERKKLTYPWHKGLKVEQIEAYYDETGWTDYKHADAGSPILKAQHPEFELWSQGIHARSGVSCADCHMPYKREGAIKVSDHQVRSPMLNVNRACQTCHHFPEEEMQARVTAIQDRTKKLMSRSEDAVVDLIKALEEARKGGATDEVLQKARACHRKAQWRVDFINAENSHGFHAPQEAARILAEAIDYARQGQLEVVKAKQGKP
jgi:nitrite reductase (cytochrome c-552)